MTRRITVILPEETVTVVDRVTTKGSRSRIIDPAILHYIMPTFFTAGARSSAKVPPTPSKVTGNPRWNEGRIAELERKVAQQVTEIDFLKRCLQRIKSRKSGCCRCWLEIRRP